jgi:hypothetical protein
VTTFSYSGFNPQIKLSPEEMLEISQEINRKFAPGPSTKKTEPSPQYPLSAKEMLQISEEIKQDFAPRASNNLQELVILPVDPDHLYAYWNLGDGKPSTALKIDSSNILTLRIFSAPDKNADISISKSWFDIAIDRYQAQQSIFLPKRVHETTYRATIGKHDSDNSLAPFAYSNVTHVPFGKLMPIQVKENQIVLKTMPQFMKASLGTSLYTNNSASGQGNN